MLLRDCYAWPCLSFFFSFFFYFFASLFNTSLFISIRFSPVNFFFLDIGDWISKFSLIVIRYFFFFFEFLFQWLRLYCLVWFLKVGIHMCEILTEQAQLWNFQRSFSIFIRDLRLFATYFCIHSQIHVTFIIASTVLRKIRNICENIM